MSKQWDGFNQEWLDKQKNQEQAKKQLQNLDKAIYEFEQETKLKIQICIAKGIHAKNEEELHMAVVEYIRLAYPDRFQWTHSDMSGFRLGIKARGKLGTMKHSRGFPDVVIYDIEEPGHNNLHTPEQPQTRAIGMAMELKHIDCKPKPYKKDGELSTDIHIQEQAAWLEQFRKLGFLAYFVIGFEQAKAKIDAYFNPGMQPDTKPIGPGSVA